MTDDLYDKKVLRHAARSAHAGRLENPDISETVDNPLCGDRITIELKVDQQGHIEQIAQETRACVLCQASASMLAEGAAGEQSATFSNLEAEVAEMLKQDGPAPGGKWAEFAIFEAVRPYKGRHNCVMLPITALIRALEKVRNRPD